MFKCKKIISVLNERGQNSCIFDSTMIYIVKRPSYESNISQDINDDTFYFITKLDSPSPNISQDRLWEIDRMPNEMSSFYFQREKYSFDDFIIKLKKSNLEDDLTFILFHQEILYGKYYD